MTHTVMDWLISPVFLRGDNSGLGFLLTSSVLPGRSHRGCLLTRLYRALGLGAQLGNVGHILTPLYS